MRCAIWALVLNLSLPILIALIRDALYFVLVQDCREGELAGEQDTESEEEMPTTHVAYSTDAKNFEGLLTSIASLSLHLRNPGTCTIHLFIAPEDLGLARHLPGCLRRQLASLPTPPQVLLHELRPLAFDYPSAFNSSVFRSHFLRKPQALVRLYLHEYLPPDVPRVLWLDHDTIIEEDVGQLYRMRMTRALAAGWDAQRWIRLRDVLQNCGLDETAIPSPLRKLSRFNSGVLLFDLHRWRSGAITRSIEAWLRVTSGCDGDQLLLNLHFGHEFDVIGWRWNVLGFNAVTFGSFLRDLPQRCLQGARLLHWNGDGKPWNRSRDTPHRDLWERYTPTEHCEALG